MSACCSWPRNGKVSALLSITFQSEQLVNKFYYKPRKSAAKTLVIFCAIYGNGAFKNLLCVTGTTYLETRHRSPENEYSARPAVSRNNKNVAKSLHNRDTLCVMTEQTANKIGISYKLA
jgi:hypothetical protein